MHVLTGVPGAGGTQLAAAYARAKLTAGWRLVAWVDAESPGSVLVGLAAVADAVGLSGSGPSSDAADRGRAVRQWLEADGHRCLLVFDGAEDPDLLRPFLPASGAARVLITSTRPSMAELGVGVPVGAFVAEQARAFLAGRTGLTDEAGSGAVAAELDYVPLGLAAAAAVIARQDRDYGGYLERLRAPQAAEIAEEAEPDQRARVRAVLVSLELVRAARLTYVPG